MSSAKKPYRCRCCTERNCSVSLLPVENGDMAWEPTLSVRDGKELNFLSQKAASVELKKMTTRTILSEVEKNCLKIVATSI